MKKLTVYILTLLCLAACLSGCGRAEKKESGERLRVVCTVFPEYDWLRALTAGADNVELTLISKNGTDMHSYQATARDLVKIASCDLLVYVGGSSDGWIEDALAAYEAPDRRAVSLLDILGGDVKNEEHKEGMEEEPEGHDEGAHEHEEPDEHVWLSVKNAETICGELTEELCELDPENSEIYTQNGESYIEKLRALDAEYEDAAASGDKSVLLFAGRFPFRYLTEDYGLDYYAAFPGCSSETEASFSTIIFLAERCDEFDLDYVIITDPAENGVAGAIIENTKKSPGVLTMDPMQSVTDRELKEGKTYISAMEQNLDVLKKALG